jgi:hypothetical protein
MPSPADILAGYGGPYEPYPDPGGGAPVTMADVLTGAVERLSAPQRVAKNVVGGAYEDFLELTKRNIAASARQEIDPGALFRQTLDIATAATPVAVRGAAGIFGGRLGAQRLAEAGQPEKLEKLAVAEAMLAKGATREEIYDTTGWWQNQIGQWQVEFPDYAAGFRPQAEQLLPQLGEPKVARGAQGQITDYTAAPVVKPGQQAFTEHAFAHPDLYAAYPELRQILMRFEDPTPETSWVTLGGMDPINRELYLNPAAFEPQLARQMGRLPGVAGMRSTTLHELTHGVQQLEGFPRGGGPGFPEVQRAADQEIKQNIKQWEDQLAAVHAKRDEWIAQKQAEGATESVQTLAAHYFAANPQAVRDSADLHSKIYNANRGIGRQELLAKHYRRLAGEVEARNVQYRADLPEETLRELPPWETQEVPYGEQLIRMGDPALGMQAELPSFPARMQAGKDVEFARAQRGQGTGNYGLPLGGYRTPEAPKGSFERLAAEQRAGFRADKERIIDEYRTATGQPPRGVSEPLLAPGETAEDISKYFNLEFMPGESAGPIGGVGVASPYVRNPNAPLFDYTRLGERIETPQFGLQRTEATNVTPDFLRAASPANIRRVNKIVEQGIREGGLDWHNLLPLKEEYISELGAGPGAQAFEDYIKRVGATSPGSNVLQNFRTASYYDWLIRQGLPLPEIVTSAKGLPSIPPGVIPHPYGNLTQALQVSNLRNLQSGAGYPLHRPKPPSFAENLLGNYWPVAIDRHNLTLWGINRGEPNVTGYRFLEDLQQQQARRMGIEPAQYQAAGWLPYAESGNVPALQLFENRIRDTAEATGLTMAEVLRAFIRGQMPLQ